MIATILITAVIIYFIQLIILRIGMNIADRASIVEHYEPKVSIIVAARNEENFINDCLVSLVQLEYPIEKLEIIIVNDGSTDKTPEIIQTYLKAYSNMRTLSTTQGDGNLRGKTNAIAQGLAASNGEIIMFTDADCRVPVGWVREIVKYFDTTTGIVGGFTLLDARRPFEGMQSLDWFFLFGLASSTVGWDIPLTVIGNNLSISRKAYNETGGFQSIPFSVTEDYALVQAMLQRTKYKIKFPVNPNTLVRSRACQSLNHLYRQKQRWGVGGLDMVVRGLLITAVGWIAKFCLLVGLFYSSLIIWLTAFFIMLFGELIFLLKPLRKLGTINYLKHFPFFIVYFFIYVLVLPIVAYTSKKVIWKERDLN